MTCEEIKGKETVGDVTAQERDNKGTFDVKDSHRRDLLSVIFVVMMISS
jgi:hypothetical protein